MMIVGVVEERIQIMGGGFGMKWLEKTDKRRAYISPLVEESNRNEAKKKEKEMIWIDKETHKIVKAG